MRGVVLTTLKNIGLRVNMINKEYTQDLILDFIAEGYSLDMIADMLKLTKETVLSIMRG